jgi:ADP-ribose pyrophosphatase
VVFALTEEGEVVLTRQFRPGPERVLWDLPSGFVDEGEDPADAAARELREETGYEASSPMRRIGEVAPNAYSSEVRHLFVAEGCRKASGQDTDAGEEIEVVVVPVAEVRRIAAAGEMTAVDCTYMAMDALGLLS